MFWLSFFSIIFFFSFAQAELEYQGQLGAFASQMPGQNQSDVTKNSAGVDAQLQLRQTWKRNYNFQARTWLQSDGANKSPKEKFQYEVQDFFFEWKKSARRFKLGVSSPVWEGTDFLNPMDLIVAKNYSDLFNIRNRGSAGLFYSDQLGPISWDLIYIPWQTRSTLPGEQSPWYPRSIALPVDTDQITLRLPPTVEYKVQPEESLRGAQLHNAGLRLQYRGDLLDFSVAGFEGTASQPLLLPTVRGIIIPPSTVELQNPVEILPVYYRQRVGAFALVTHAGSWIFRLSAQHAQPLGSDPRLPSWSEFGVFAIEKTIDWRDQGITLIAQFVGARRPQSESLSALSSLLEKAAMLGVRFPVRENLTWNAAFFQEQKNKSSFFHSDITWNLNDHWRTELAADILSGDPSSALGTYEANDRYGLRLVYGF